MGGADAPDPIYDVPLTHDYGGKNEFQMPNFDFEKTVGSKNMSNR